MKEWKESSSHLFSLSPFFSLSLLSFTLLTPSPLFSSLSLISLTPTKQDDSADQEGQTQSNLDKMWQDDCQWYAYRWGGGLAVCIAVVSSCKVKRGQKSQEVSHLRFVHMDAEVTQDYRRSAILREVTDIRDAAAHKQLSWVEGAFSLVTSIKLPFCGGLLTMGYHINNFWREKTKDVKVSWHTNLWGPISPSNLQQNLRKTEKTKSHRITN